MIDLSSDLRQNQIVEQQRAELYMRIFKYAAEDFANHADLDKFMNALTTYLDSIESRMNNLSKALMSHTHPITPHVHPIPTHIHNIPPHTHVGNLGYPVSPMPLITMPGGPGSSSANAELQTGAPQQSSQLKWPTGNVPAKYINSSGVASNMTGNMVTMGSSTIGSADVHQRRVSIIPETTVPQVPPYLTPNTV